MPNITNDIASKFLGKQISVSENYDANLLVAIPRSENRRRYEIDNYNLPFWGFDVWHAYEFSCLCDKGLPITKVLKINYDCTSEFIIESKSLKLYLNSFNMSRFGKNTEDCLITCKNIIENDLSKALKTNVTANFITDNINRTSIFEDFVDIKNYIDEKNILINDFKESPDILEYDNLGSKKEYYLKFDAMRSNCRVTHQPDFGDLFIYYESEKHILEESLIKYLTSFRTEYHFHEECCEMIYKRLYDLLNDYDKLFVGALYTRRGGIDICPMRLSKSCTLKDIELLKDTNIYARNGLKQ